MFEANGKPVDWVTEKVFAADTGFTARALEAKRQRGQLPEGLVWIKNNGRILYSRRGWDTWVESQRNYRTASARMEIASSSDLIGTANGSGSRSRSQSPGKTSNVPVVYEV